VRDESFLSPHRPTRQKPSCQVLAELPLKVFLAFLVHASDLMGVRARQDRTQRELASPSVNAEVRTGQRRKRQRRNVLLAATA
jgi:hypothetical protein